MCKQEDNAVAEAWEEQAPIEWRCDLARGVVLSLLNENVMCYQTRSFMSKQMFETINW
jgi:hypothetical protein